MNRNLGQTSLRRKRRSGDPIVTHLVRRIWSKSRAKGRSDDDALAFLGQAEARTLARHRQSNGLKLNSIF